MKKFTKVSLIIVAVMAGVGILFLGLSSMMGAGYGTLRQMARNGDFDFGNWHFWEYGVYYSDDDDLPVIDASERSDAWNEFEADTVKQLKLEADVVEIVFTQSKENDKISVQLNDGDLNKYDCFAEDGILQVKYGVENHAVYSKKGPELILALPEGIVLEEMDLDIGASELDFETSSIICDTLTMNVGAGDVDAGYIEVRKQMEIVIGAGEVDIEGGSFQDIKLDCGVGSISLNGTLSGNLNAHCGMGEIDMKLAGTETDYNYDLSCGMGELTVNDTSYSNIGGSRKVQNEGADQTITLDCGMGSVELEIYE